MKSLRLALRFLVVGGLALLLLVPLSMIRGVVHDRERYRAQAVERVSQSMAGPQRLVGPLRVVPWRESRRVDALGPDGQPQVRTEVVEGHLLQAPASLRVDGVLVPDVRRIGLYDVRVFEWKARVEAEFPALDVPAKHGREYGQPYLAVGIADVRGLVGTPVLAVDGRVLPLQAGTGALARRMGGLHAPLPAGAGGLAASRARLDMNLAGTQSLAIAPVADGNRIALRSPWPHPLFGGRFLPNRRELGDDGFSASWNVSSLASAAQAQLLDGEGRVGGDAAEGGAIDTVDVSLVDPVDVYTQADRATKYGILFVLLTFVAFALFELIKRLPIHPLQYLLVGLALAVFFLLLLGLSEHIAFWRAYLASALACIGLQFAYLCGVLRSRLRAAGFASMLTALYGVLYGLLASEDNALLMGSLLLFGILAAIMWVTRRVDWYALGGPEAGAGA